MPVYTSPQIRVSINNQQRTTVRTIAVTSAQNKTLDGLEDVNASNPDNNEVLVYDGETNTYVVKILPVLDGGTF